MDKKISLKVNINQDYECSKDILASSRYIGRDYNDMQNFTYAALPVSYYLIEYKKKKIYLSNNKLLEVII